MDEPTSPHLIKVRGHEFLAQTGDRASILALLSAIGHPDPQVAQYSLEAVFKNPQAYAELMDLNSLGRIRVIQRYSEADPLRAIQFSVDSLVQPDPNLKLLALDVLDYNLAYLQKNLELPLKQLLADPAERVRVKASRLLLLLSEYEPLELDSIPVVRILEAALDSDDTVCRQMAFGMPSSVFYKIKSVKSALASLQGQIAIQQAELAVLQKDNQQLEQQLQTRTQQLKQHKQMLAALEHTNQHQQTQLSALLESLKSREVELQQYLKERADLSQALLDEKEARISEVESAQQKLQSLVQDYRQREETFKQGFYDFYLRMQTTLQNMQQQQ